MSRLDVRKTYKLYINGEFPRSESGRSYPALSDDGQVLARVALASRKDLRDAVRAARSAQSKWAEKSGYNRGQILYRIAEMIEDRLEVFARQLTAGPAGLTIDAAVAEVEGAVDMTVWYAGWADKYAQIVGNVNPVAGPFFNLSVPEPTGVVGVVAPPAPALLGLISRAIPVLVSGNAVVLIASEPNPIPAVTLAEALATSDVPAGVLNTLTGDPAELVPPLARHMDVNAVDVSGAAPDLATEAQALGADNVKRVVTGRDPLQRSPYFVADFTEIKTVWHPKGT